MNEWSFADPMNVATITIRQIIDDGQPILYVTHDEDDGMWPFLSGGPAAMVDAMVLGLSEVHRIDPSVGELADLPIGWIAERSAVREPWHRRAKF